jgi:hypothetical protein
MANWANPTLSSLYTNFLADLKARDDDLARGLDPAVATVTSPPTNAIRWNSASKKWQKWSGSAWADLSAAYAINVEGTLAAPAGSVSAPSIAFQGSATTGFYRPSADRVALAIAGVQRLFASNTGRFSFGAGESPQGVVSIAGGDFVVQETGADRALAFLNADGSVAYGQFGAASSGSNNRVFVANPRTGGTVALSVAGTDRVTVSATGATFAVPISGSGSGLTSLPAGQLTGTVAVTNGGTGKSTLNARALLGVTDLGAIDDTLIPATEGEFIYSSPANIGPGAPILWFKTSFVNRLKNVLNAGGDAPVYACRAWATFSNVEVSGTYSQSGTTIAITINGHGMNSGEGVYLDFTSPDPGGSVDGFFTVYNATADTFQVDAASSLTVSGNVTRKVHVRARGNVASVVPQAGVAYRISFTTQLADSQYAWSGSVRFEGANPQGIICATTNCLKSTGFLDVEIGNSANAFNITSSEIHVMVFR